VLIHKKVFSVSFIYSSDKPLHSLRRTFNTGPHGEICTFSKTEHQVQVKEIVQTEVSFGIHVRIWARCRTVCPSVTNINKNVTANRSKWATADIFFRWFASDPVEIKWSEIS